MSTSSGVPPIFAHLRNNGGDWATGALPMMTEMPPILWSRSLVREMPYFHMHEAWNYLGYSQRKLGRYDAALTAYDRALTLKPGYPEALEYRGHAYLGLNRLGDAKDAYLALFASNRKLAASLLTGMQQWLGNHRAGAGVDPGSYDAFASWVRERGAIASQTAGLTREGAAAAW